MNKFRITKTSIDLTKLNKEIQIYQNNHHSDPWIFMNKETMAEISLNSTDFYLYGMSNGIIRKYRSYRVFEDSTLDFGEIELR